jgi:ABC-type branched-subunit amino acid transport system substrate-binding protein
VVDDGSNAQQAVSATRTILANKPNLFIPDSPLAPSILPFANGVFTIDGCGDAICTDGKKFPDQFTINATYADQVSALLAYAHSKGYTKVGVLAQSGAEGAGFIQASQQAAKAYGETIVGSESYDATAPSYTTELSSLLSDGSQAIIADLIGTTISTAMTGVQSLGTKVPLISDESAFVTNVDQSVPASVQDQLVGVAFRWTARPAGGMQDAPPYIAKLYNLTSQQAHGNIFSFGVATTYAESLAEADYAYKTAGSLSVSGAVKALDNISTAKNVPLDTFPFWYGVNPSYHGLVHGTDNADVGNDFFSVVKPGSFENGTFLGTPFKFQVKK